MKRAATEREPRFSSEDGYYSEAPPFGIPSTPPSDDVSEESRLRARFQSFTPDQLVDRLVAAELRLLKYERAASELVSTLALAPEMTEAFYARALRDLLTDALLTLDSVEELRHVESSMPCVRSESPRVTLVDWRGLHASRWDVQWAPHSWWVSVSAVGSRWGLGFNVLTRVSGIFLRGRVRCAFSGDLTSLRVSFVEKPELAMGIESSVGWGVVPLPVREQIEGMVREEIEGFVERRLTGEESMVVVLRRKAVEQLSEEDIAEATDQALRASHINLRSNLLL